MEIFLTGSSGFLGSNLLIKFPKEWNVVAFDLKPLPAEIKKLAKCRVKSVAGSISDGKKVEKFSKKCDAFVHLAGIVGKDCEADVEKTLSANIVGTQIVANAAKKSNARIVFASTYFVYGFKTTTKPPFKENSPLIGDTVYNSSKLFGEKIIEQNKNRAILRLASIYGKGHGLIECGGVIQKFIEAGFDGKKLLVSGKGNQKIDYVHVDDACNAILFALKSEEKNLLLNVGGGKPLTVNEIALGVSKIFKKRFNKKLEIKNVQSKESVFPDKWLSIEKIGKKIKRYPSKKLIEGIDEMVENRVLPAYFTK